MAEASEEDTSLHGVRVVVVNSDDASTDAHQQVQDPDVSDARAYLSTPVPAHKGEQQQQQQQQSRLAGQSLAAAPRSELRFGAARCSMDTERQSTTASSIGMQNISYIQPMVPQRLPSIRRSSHNSLGDVDMDAFSSQVRESVASEVPSSWTLFQPSDTNYMTEVMSGAPEQARPPSISHLASTQLLRLLEPGNIEGSWPEEDEQPRPQAQASSSSLAVSSSSNQVNMNIDANFISSLVPVAPTPAAAGSASNSNSFQGFLTAAALAGPSAPHEWPSAAAGGTDSGAAASAAAAVVAEASSGPESAGLAGTSAGPSTATRQDEQQDGDRAIDASELELSLASHIKQAAPGDISSSQQDAQQAPAATEDKFELSATAQESSCTAVAPTAGTEEAAAQGAGQADGDAAAGSVEAEEAVPAPAGTHARPQPQQEEQQLDDWDLANQAREAELQQGQQAATAAAATGTGAGLQPVVLPAVADSYAAAESYFLSLALPAEVKQQVADSLPQPSGLFCCISRPDSTQQEQLQQLLGLAKLCFDDSNPQHLALLQAVHAAYTGSSTPAARYGPHWDALGFQGNDPATDLRGCGMLGLLHLLALQQHSPSAAQRVYTLSRDAEQGFPLAIVSINITRWVLQAARAGSLARHAPVKAGKQALWRASVAMLAGCWFELHQRWVQGGRTMLDSGVVLKQLQKFCTEHVGEMVRRGQAGKL